MLLQNLIERMGSELADEDAYIDNRDIGRGIPDKEIPIEMPIDYDGIDALNPKTSIRDQEYLQHSTLWSHQQLNNYKTNDRHKIKTENDALPSPVAAAEKTKEEKTENQLPAYCTPPNPCPVGYTSKFSKAHFVCVCFFKSFIWW